MLDIFTIVHCFADVQTAGRIRQTCRRLAMLQPVPKRYIINEIKNKYRVGEKIHRLDGPAVEIIDKFGSWYRGGVAHREYHPRTIKHNRIYYMVNGEYHREVYHSIDYYESKYWYTRGLQHRKVGPAADTGTGRRWCTFGKLHRLDGPAFIGYSYICLYAIRNIEHRISGTTSSRWIVNGVIIR